jgi:hypothetical protein
VPQQDTTRPGGRRPAFDESGGEIGVVVVADAGHDLLAVPHRADLAVGVAGVEQPQQFGAAPVVKTFVGSGQ